MSLAAGLLAVLFGFATVPGHADGCSATCSWGYGPQDGPNRWAELCCPVCAGHSQSPIDILTPRARAEESGGLTLNYGTTHLELSNDGRTILASDQLEQGENTIEVGGRTYPLTEFHFHSLSEHTIDGKRSPLELHLEHRRTSYDIAVLAVLIDEGEENAAFGPMWKSLPTDTSVDPRTVILNPKRLLPKDLSYYTYSGSDTRPPCAEVVTWYVLQNPIEISIEQIEAFRAIFDSNYRPTQPLGGRVLRKSP